MNPLDILEVIAFVGTLLGIAFSLGKQAYRLQILEKDLNMLGNEYRQDAKKNDQRLDRLAEFVVRTDQRIIYLEERAFGEETAGRMRE